MPAKIVITDAAKLAIIEQWEQYDARQGSELAGRWDMAAGLAIESLRQASHRGSGCGLLHPRLSDLRWIPVKGFPYRIFYLTANPEVVTVVLILHKKRDVADLLESAIRNL